MGHEDPVGKWTPSKGDMHRVEVTGVNAVKIFAPSPPPEAQLVGSNVEDDPVAYLSVRPLVLR